MALVSNSKRNHTHVDLRGPQSLAHCVDGRANAIEKHCKFWPNPPPSIRHP